MGLGRIVKDGLYEMVEQDFKGFNLPENRTLTTWKIKLRNLAFLHLHSHFEFDACNILSKIFGQDNRRLKKVLKRVTAD